jgi:LPXTG-motif cell wall-anchored protein
VPDRPGKTGAPSVDTPIVLGKNRQCVAEGSGFVCPLGAIPPGTTRRLRLAVRARPHAHPGRLRCLSTVASGTPDENPANDTVACHTRNARPMSAPEHPGVNRLPHTGFPYGTVALAALGLAAAGFVLLWVGRTRRGEEV